MKKIFAATVLASTALTAHANSLATSPLVGARYSLDAYSIDTAGNTTLLPGRQISKSNSTHRLCWQVVSDTPIFDKNVAVKEVFQSPQGAVFNDGKSIVQSSFDGTKHTVTTLVNSINQSAIQRCWQFDSSDPTGIYKLDAEIADFALPSQTFAIVP